MRIKSLFVTAVLATAILCFSGAPQVQAAACSPSDAACLTSLLSQLQAQLSSEQAGGQASLQTQVDILQTQLELLQLQGQPSITYISPSSGSAGTQVTVTGAGFSSITGIYLGNTIISNLVNPNTVQINSDTSLTFTVPVSMTSGTYCVNFTGNSHRSSS